jgi:16S rRNA (cytidine1402-2'-O)-methyltransferase
MVIYEAPHRLKKTLELLRKTLGDERSISICKEITKKHESFKKTTIGEAIMFYEAEENQPRGEYVLVIAGKSYAEQEAEERAKWEGMSIEEHIRYYIEQGVDKKEAVKKVASDRGLSKREVYSVSVDMDI